MHKVPSRADRNAIYTSLEGKLFNSITHLIYAGKFKVIANDNEKSEYQGG